LRQSSPKLIAMAKNIGEKYSLVRLFTGVGFVVLSVVFLKSPPFAVIVAAYVAALVLAATSIVGNCPLYSLFGVNKKNGKVA